MSDQVLGSTAIFGMVDTGLFLKERPHFRRSNQAAAHQRAWQPAGDRTGLHPNKESVSLGTAKEKADLNRVAEEILGFLRSSDKPTTKRPSITMFRAARSSCGCASPTRRGWKDHARDCSQGERRPGKESVCVFHSIEEKIVVSLMNFVIDHATK